MTLNQGPQRRQSFLFRRSGRGVTWRVRSPQDIRSLQRKPHLSVVWLVQVRNLRTKTRRNGSLTWLLQLTDRGVRTRHDQQNLTAIYASNSHVGVGHPSLWKRPQNVVSMKKWKQDSVDASATVLECGRLELKKKAPKSPEKRRQGGRDGRGTRHRGSDQETGAKEHIQEARRTSAEERRGSAKRTGMRKTEQETALEVTQS